MARSAIDQVFTREELLKTHSTYKTYSKSGSIPGISGKAFRRKLFKALDIKEPTDSNIKICRRCYVEFSREDEVDSSWNRLYICQQCKEEKRLEKKEADRNRELKRYHTNRESIGVHKRSSEHRAKMRMWNSNNKDKIAHYKSLRRTKYKEGDTPEVKSFISDLYSNPHKKCRYCPETEKLTLEHILPLSREGLHSCDNLDLACSTCNSSKRDKTEEEYTTYLKLIKGQTHGS